MLRMQLAFILGELIPAGLSYDDIAALTGRTKSSISRYLLGQTVPKLPVLRDILRVLGVDEDHPAVVRGRVWAVSDIEAIANEANRRGWFQSRFGDVQIPDWLFTYFGLEPAAENLRIFHLVIPGLFQTEEYATRVIGAETTDATAVRNHVAIKVARQELFSRPNPPAVHLVLDEGALSRRVDDAEVMRGQLRRLVERALLPNVTFQVLPFEAGAHAARVACSFVILGFGERLPDVVYQESYGRTGSLTEGHVQVADFNNAFRDISDHALAPDDSVAMLRRLAGRTPRKQPGGKAR